MLYTIRKILLVLTKKEKKRLGMLMVLDLVMSVADIVFLALLLLIIQVYTATPPVSKFRFLPDGLIARNELLFIIVFFLLFSLKNLASYLVFRAQSRYLFQVASRISRNKLIGYLEGAYSDYIDTDSSANIRKISHDPTEFAQHILGGIQQMFTQMVLILLTIGAILFFNAKLFLLLFIILLPPVIAVFYLIRSKSRSKGMNARATSEKALQHLQEALSGFVESNIYDKNEVFLDRYMTDQKKFNKIISDHVIVQGIPSRMIEIFSLLGIVILIVINRWTGNADSTAVITIGVFMAAAYKIIPGIVKILNLSGQLNTYAFTVQGLAPPDALPAREFPAGPVKKIGSIAFKGVRYYYGDRLILNSQDLHITSGDFLGIAGASGKGKTTILNLLLGFLTPAKGEIQINGLATDTRERQQYWRNIAYVKQQPFLLHDTILQNITLDGQACDEQKLREVLEVSGLTALIETFPEKWNKTIAENGKNISGGQKQRIALARALYKNADLIILDEPFNELDEASENSLLRYFQTLAHQGKLVILITHNKESLGYCNKIVSLDENAS